MMQFIILFAVLFCAVKYFGGLSASLRKAAKGLNNLAEKVDKR